MLGSSTPLPPGVHLEGPFISREKRGAHPEAHLRSFEANAFHDVLATYGPLDNVRIVTLAPELGRSREVIRALAARGICVSLGEGGRLQGWARMGVLGWVCVLSPGPPCRTLGGRPAGRRGSCAVWGHLHHPPLQRHAACESPPPSPAGGRVGTRAPAIAQLSPPIHAQFHHRDPGIVGLLTSDRLPPGRHIFYGMIADGTHTNPAALRIAHRAHPQGEWQGRLGAAGRTPRGSSKAPSSRRAGVGHRRCSRPGLGQWPSHTGAAGSGSRWADSLRGR